MLLRHITSQLWAQSPKLRLFKHVSKTLPFVLTSSLVENILLAVDRQDTILQCALPVNGVSKQTQVIRWEALMHTTCS
jgi:hypothetical protein